MHEQEWAHADEPHHRGDKNDDGRVGRHCTEPEIPTAVHQPPRQPMPQNENIGGPYREHDEGVTIYAIAEPAPLRKCQIFAHRQRVDVPYSAALQITGRRMMYGMSTSPECKWGQGQHTYGAADPVVGQTLTEERAVAAIVLDHEEPDEKACCRKGQQQA